MRDAGTVIQWADSLPEVQKLRVYERIYGEWLEAAPLDARSWFRPYPEFNVCLSAGLLGALSEGSGVITP